MSNWILTMKILLISSGVVSLAIAMKLAVPLVINFTVYDLPTLWSVLVLLFKPPYLYVIINGIIISIVASTRFAQNDSPPSNDQSQPLISARTPPPIVFSDALDVDAPVVKEAPPTPELEVAAYEDEFLEVKEPVLVEGNGLEVVENDKQVAENEEELVVSRSTYSPPQTIVSQETITETETVKERPLVMSRFGHRKPLKASPEGGRALRVARPKRQETLESTWKMITEGRHVPLTRHLKKSDTFENHRRHVDVSTQDDNCSSPPNPQVGKAKTFKDRTNYHHDLSMNSGKIRKEPSLSQDELNRRAEAFIKKFNEEMRLQRLESLQQFTEMINRGAY